MKYASIIFRNLARNRRRSILTALAIALAVFAYATLAGLPFLLENLSNTPASARRLVTMNTSGFFFPLPAAYRAKIQALPHVVATSAIVYFGGAYRSASDQLGVGIDADEADKMWPDWGITAARADLLQHELDACLVPPAMMHKYGWQVGETIMLRGTVYPSNVSLRIADALGDHAPPDMLMLRRDYLENVIGPGHINAYYVVADREDSVATLLGTIDEGFVNSSAPTHSASEANWISAMMNLSALTVVLKVAAASAVIAMTLVAFNTTALATRERRVEIAVLRALGFGRLLVVWLFLAESLVLGLAGGLLGCAGAYVIARILPGSLLPLGPVDVFAIMPLRLMAQAFVLAPAIAGFAGLLPAMTLVRRGIAESLRAVG